MSGDYKVVSNPVLNVHISSNVSSFGSERRFNKDLTVAALKGKLELVTGGSVGSMQLEVYDQENKLVCKLDNDDALLGSYHVDDGMRIHVIDTSGNEGQFEDVSKVKKFELSEEEYTKRTDSVRAFKQQMKLGRYADVDSEEQKRQDEEKLRKAKEEQDKVSSMKIGDRCEVRVSGQPTRRGTVMYTGETSFKPGLWVGLKYDEPLGKNDGSVAGRRYFECPPKYGGFVKPSQVEVGDFPEEDFEDEDEEL